MSEKEKRVSSMSSCLLSLGEKIKVERQVTLPEGGSNAAIAALATLPEKELYAAQKESEMKEKILFDEMLKLCVEWEEQALNTLSLKLACSLSKEKKD